MKRILVAGVLCALTAGSIEAQGRLFAVYADGFNQTFLDDYEGPPRAGEGDLPAILELDPANGATLNTLPPPEPPSGGPDGLAFDGTSLWYLATAKVILEGPLPPGATLYELNPDSGAILDADFISSGSGFYDGIGAVGGLIYIQDYEADLVHVFDPASDSIVDTLDVGAANPGVHIIGGFSGIGAPNALLATGSTEDVQRGIGAGDLYEIDPASGIVLNSFPLGGISLYGVATVGQTVYVASGSEPVVYLYSRDGTLLDVFNGTGPFSALGGDPPPTAAAIIPTASTLGLAFLSLALVAGGLLLLRKKNPAA